MVGRINRHERQRLARRQIGDRLADEHVVEARHAHDVARVRLGDFDSLQPFKVEDGGDFALGLAAIPMQAGGGVADLDLAAVNFAKGDAAQVIGIIQVGHQQS